MNRKRWMLGILDNIMGVALGLFLVSSVLRYMDYRAKPEIYMVNSAPWYSGVIISGIFSLVIIVFSMVFKYVLLKKLAKEENNLK